MEYDIGKEIADLASRDIKLRGGNVLNGKGLSRSGKAGEWMWCGSSGCGLFFLVVRR